LSSLGVTAKEKTNQGSQTEIQWKLNWSGCYRGDGPLAYNPQLSHNQPPPIKQKDKSFSFICWLIEEIELWKRN